MQGLHGRVFLAVAVAMIASGASAQYSGEPGAFELPFSSRTVNPFQEPGRFDVPAMPIRPTVYRVEGARFVKLHFSRFDLPEGITVEVSNPSGSETWRYSADQRDLFTVENERGDDGIGTFWSMSVSGDTAVVRLTGSLWRFDPALHGVEIDTHLSDAVVKPESSKTDKSAADFGSLETNCGESELYDAVCWTSTYPNHYDRSRPVALIITASGKQCTAWRAGNDNRMFTARHCLPSQAELDGAEIWFDYEATVCNGDESVEAVKVTGDELLYQHYKLDFSLFTVNDFSRIKGFGNLGLDLRDGSLGEEIFIPQHGLGNPKQIAIESDMNSGGLCKIDANDLDGFFEGSDIGYMCDTTTSSSGSPVISGETGRAIALHHWGGCYNSGTKMSHVWPHVSEFFDGVPEGDAEGGWAEPNKPPSARYSVACSGLSCEFDGGDSRDPDGSVRGWAWQIDGKVLEGRVVNHEFGKDGEYDVSLTVSDDEGATDSLEDSVSVSLPNEAPEAKFSSRCVASSCTFDASGSSDPDGDIASWYWDLGDGTMASGEKLEHQYDVDGNYWVSLTVRDDDGDKGTDGHSVTIATANKAPVAKLQVSCDQLSCKADGSSSSDADGTIVDWRWDFGDGHQASGERAEHQYDSAGSYVIRLEVEDDKGDRSETTMQVEAKAGNAEPTASFTFECAEGLCRFDASRSADEDGRITDWSWQFGDGSTGYGEVVDHRYNDSGVFTVQLEVTDNGGATSDKTRYVQLEVPSDEPHASFSVDCDGLVCTLDAGSSTASATAGSITRYDWSFGDGTTATGGAVKHEYDRNGRYTVTLKVTDSSKTSGASQRTIEVEGSKPVLLDAKLIGSSGKTAALLEWSGTEGGQVSIYRDGQLVANVVDSGAFTDRKFKVTTPTVRYRVCEAASKRCSNPVKLHLEGK